jgi:hypothetical protein
MCGAKTPVWGEEGEQCARFRVFKDAGTGQAFSRAGLNYRSRAEVRNGVWAFTLAIYIPRVQR